jgi:hypothetical protein
MPYNSPQYSPQIPTRKESISKIKRQHQKVFDFNAWGALGEVVRMAEGRHGISLGRMTFNERKA